MTETNETGTESERGYDSIMTAPISTTEPATETPISPRKLRSDHDKEKGRVLEEAAELEQGPRTPESATLAFANSKNILEQAGLNLNSIPQSIKPIYIKAVNLFRNYHQRLASKRKDVEKYHANLVEVERQLCNQLYGNDPDKVGGLYKKLMNAEDKKVQCKKVKDELDRSINETSARIKKTQETIEDKVNANETSDMRQLGEDMMVYSRDLAHYQSLKQKSMIQWTTLEAQSKCYLTEAKAAKIIYNKVQSYRSTVEAYLENAVVSTEGLEVLTKFSELVQSFGDKIKGLDEMVESGYRATEQRIDATLNFSGNNPEIPKPYTLKGLKDMGRENEVKNDEIEQKMKDSKPYSNMRLI